jgi:adenylate cyclase
MDLRTEFSRPPDIVIADDDWYIRDVLENYLVNAGCQVRAFPNGELAWQAVQEQRPDLMLLDVRMPVMDGLSVCRQIKGDSSTQFIPVVIVTALDSQDDELIAIEAGADDFITKPFSSIILLTRVRSLLRLKKLHDDLESRNQLLNQILNRYVDQEISDIILTDPERYLKLGGETRQVSVFFADLRDFTQFSASTPATQVVDTLNLVFKELVEIVLQHKGTFDKFLGDAIMAFYGAPIGGDDDTRRALHTALDMQRCFRQLQSETSNQFLSSLGLGVGIHSGEAIVGNIGSERLMDYTVIGDTVNIARRLQETARAGEILISSSVIKLVPNVDAERKGLQQLAGRTKPVDVYRLLGLDD